LAQGSSGKTIFYTHLSGAEGLATASQKSFAGVVRKILRTAPKYFRTTKMSHSGQCL